MGTGVGTMVLGEWDMKPGDLVKIDSYSVPVYAPWHGSSQEDVEAFIGRVENRSICVYLGSKSVPGYSCDAITYHMIFTSRWGTVWVRDHWVRSVDE